MKRHKLGQRGDHGCKGGPGGRVWEGEAGHREQKQAPNPGPGISKLHSHAEAWRSPRRSQSSCATQWHTRLVTLALGSGVRSRSSCTAQRHTCLVTLTLGPGATSHAEILVLLWLGPPPSYSCEINANCIFLCNLPSPWLPIRNQTSENVTDTSLLFQLHNQSSPQKFTI